MMHFSCGLKDNHNKFVLVTHGGLSCLPENLIFTGTGQMINGVGTLEDASLIDEIFNKY